MKKIIYAFFILILQIRPGFCDLDRVLNKVYQENPIIKSAKEDVNAAENDYSKASYQYLPDAELQGFYQYQESEYTTEGRPSIESDSISKGATLRGGMPLFMGGSIINNIRFARNMKRVAEELYQNTVNSVFLQTIEAYLDVMKAEKIYDLRINSEALYEKQYKTVRTLHNAGARSKSDLLRIEAAYEGAKAQTILAEAELNAAKNEYIRLVDEEPKTSKLDEIVGRVDYSDYEREFPKSRQVFLNEVREYNPLILAQKYTYEAKKKQVNVEIADFLPKVMLEAKTSHNEDFQGYDEMEESSIGVNVSIPLFQKGMAVQEFQKAKNLLRKAENDYYDAKRSVLANASCVWDNYEASKQTYQAIERKVAAAEAALNAVQIEYKIGNKSVIDLLDAESSFLDAQVELLETGKHEVLSFFNIFSFSGRLVDIIIKNDK